MTVSGGAGVFEEFTNDRNGTEKWNLVYILALHSCYTKVSNVVRMSDGG